MRYVEVAVSEYDESCVGMLKKSAILSSKLANQLDKKRRTNTYECDIDVAFGQLVVVPWGEALRVGIVKSDSNTEKVDELKSRGVVFKRIKYAVFTEQQS